MIVELPISTFSKKIIQKFDKRDPIVIRTDDPLFTYFGFIRYDRPANAGRAAQYLNDKINIDITMRMRKNPLPFLYQAGINIHKHHIMQMLIWAESQALAGGVAMTALMQWYQIYDISDDDLNFETALRKWQRWHSQRKTQLFSGNCVANTSKLWRKKRRDGEIPLPEEKIHVELSKLVFYNINYFIGDKTEFMEKLLLHVTIYYYHRHQMYGTRELAAMFGKSRRQIQRSIYNIKNIIEYDGMIGGQLKIEN
ncbi:MAG: hypothetical protein IPN67_19945 [Bacteroidales bacterium]|nr:hypothetical protein [Bacteroidales bacterium]